MKQLSIFKRLNDMKSLLFFIFHFLLFVFIGCSEEKNVPLSDSDAVPGMVVITDVLPRAGGAEIRYKLPGDPNLLYVEAELTTPQGKTLNFSASSYTAKINIEGLSATTPQPVNIYSVSRSGVRSEVQTRVIEPLPAPIISVFGTISMAPSFNSVRVNYENATGAFFTYYLCYIDDKDALIDYTSFSSKNADVTTHTFYGLPPVERKYGVYIVDKWNNYSDTVWQMLRPVVENEIPKDGFVQVMLDNDGPFYGNEEPFIKLVYLWDGEWSKSYSDPYNLGTPYGYRNFQFAGSQNVPYSFTISLGAQYRISRIRVNHYWQYTHTMGRKWEIWGSTEAPPSDGNWEWEGWIKIADMEAEKPSGRPKGADDLGEGDLEAWEQGAIAGSLTEQPIQYIRLRTILDWKGTTNFSASEITFFGAE
jgi:hypothetical protein